MSATVGDSQRLPLMWVFTYKFDEDGLLCKYKARLVVRGDLQEDWGDTYAATLAARVFRFLMALTAAFGLKAYQYDVLNAFLNAPLEKLVYVKTPDPYIEELGKILELKRALYGLKDAPLLWYKHLKETLIKLGLKSVKGVPCLFTNERLSDIFFYVDDIVVLVHPDHLDDHQKFERRLEAVYDLRKLGELKWFLGIRVLRDWTAGTIWLTQDSFIEKVVNKYDLDQKSGGRYPAVPLVENSLPQTREDTNHQRTQLYQQLVRSLAYISTFTRPDVARTHSVLARHLQNPGQKHVSAYIGLKQKVQVIVSFNLPMSTNYQDKLSMHLDAVVVGAGFSGIASLYRLRKAGLTVKAFEAGPRLGGVWHWNRYPGARVDGEYPFYQLNIPEVQQGWDWEFKFPDRKELAGYFDHLDKILGLSKDTYFNSEVTSVRYNVVEGQWTVKAGQRTATCKYLILAAGALHRAHRPDFPGLSNFAGQVYHTASWPENIDLYGKRVAVIGTGATGVQVIQELSKQVDYLLVCVRNPSYCLPMVQKRVSEEEKLATKPKLQEILAKCRNDPAGYFSAKKQGKVFDQTLEEREAYWEELWSQGGSHFASSNYSDILTDQAANLEIYNFWAKKTRAQMTDPVKMDIVAPLKPPYPFGAKRCVQAQDYYKCLNQANVEVISIQNSPISEFNRNGFVTEDGTQKNFDVLVLATGFDSFTGS
ncbi:cyclopentanone 1,2-monooxygenase [Pyrenophora tritici-repentis]|nr:cyclopentanone 1,2-monooxygenase [Pyrenophora tritici-repentis]KAI1685768.1 cyclopentanone 1,2-monooxygenase [Pyrenophora tritici-repentis]